MAKAKKPVTKKVVKKTPVKTTPKKVALTKKPKSTFKTVEIKKVVKKDTQKVTSILRPLSSDEIVGVFVYAGFALLMSYDFYLIDKNSLSLSDTIINFIFHGFVFGIFFYAIYWVLIKKS